MKRLKKARRVAHRGAVRQAMLAWMARSKKGDILTTGRDPTVIPGIDNLHSISPMCTRMQRLGWIEKAGQGRYRMTGSFNKLSAKEAEAAMSDRGAKHSNKTLRGVRHTVTLVLNNAGLEDLIRQIGPGVIISMAANMLHPREG